MIILLLIFMAIAVWVMFLYSIARKRFNQLAQERNGLSICQFARSFDYRKVDTKIIRAVYESLQEWATTKNFPVIESDNLAEIYGITADELDYFGEEIANKTGRSLDQTENNPFYDQVKTARDLVLFMNHQPKTSVMKTLFI